MPKKSQKSDSFSEEEAALRRDEVIRRMANTPPHPRAKTPDRSRRKKKAGAGLVIRKARVRREG